MTTATFRSPSRIAAQMSAEAHLSAYNAAFSDLGLRFRWDHATLEALGTVSSELARITAYIERFHAHLHKAYDADFLAQLIFNRKTEFFRAHMPQAAD
jgi:hypothetical protein